METVEKKQESYKKLSDAYTHLKAANDLMIEAKTIGGLTSQTTAFVDKFIAWMIANVV